MSSPKVIVVSWPFCAILQRRFSSQHLFKTQPGSSVRDPNLGVLFVTFSGVFIRDLHLGDQKANWKKLELQVQLKDETNALRIQICPKNPGFPL